MSEEGNNGWGGRIREENMEYKWIITPAVFLSVSTLFLICYPDNETDRQTKITQIKCVCLTFSHQISWQALIIKTIDGTCFVSHRWKQYQVCEGTVFVLMEVTIHQLTGGLHQQVLDVSFPSFLLNSFHIHFYYPNHKLLASGVSLVMAVPAGQLSCPPPLWSELNCPNIYWLDCRE